MAKRSPILGYNHNVRYRGLVFHVQTEDSGILSPHLFTHLFHGGVIVSTRKLIYDSGAAEDSIKSLMQAQHKAVLKDLRRGLFDDKIDEYLGNTPGLEPRAAPGSRTPPPRASEPELETQTPPTLPPPHVVEAAAAADLAEASAGIMSAVATGSSATIAAADVVDATLRTVAEPASDLSIETIAIAAAATIPVEPIPDATERVHDDDDSGPEIEIRLELDDDDAPEPGSGRRRLPHDTELQVRARHAIEPLPASGESDGIPMPVGKPPIPSLPDRRPGVSAAALPPARPTTRPPARPAIQTPQVASRPVISESGRRESDAIEIYSPAPQSIDLPANAPERPGEYMQTRTVRKSSHAIDTLPRDRSGANPAPVVPSGLSPLPRPPTAPAAPPAATSRAPTGGKPSRISDPIPKIIPPEPSPAAQGVIKSRVPTPPRVSAPRTATQNSGSGSGGVVMTRPAVIVGAPAKSGTPTRPRKAREEEGRGFGQGLISEKSLDEVILAYLSEDAEDK